VGQEDANDLKEIILLFFPPFC